LYKEWSINPITNPNPVLLVTHTGDNIFVWDWDMIPGRGRQVSSARLPLLQALPIRLSQQKQVASNENIKEHAENKGKQAITQISHQKF
jgi:hypothetical protein